ncbi:RDD family protein [Sulfurimonas sp.]|nr:RDD family protein [Sulfurimonas sp.]
MNEEVQNLLHREGMTLASIAKRSVAFFIDELLLSFLLILSLGDAFFEAETTEEMIILTNKFILEYIAMKIFYQAFFTMQYGASLGKLAMKIRVIDINTLSNVNVLVSLNRAVVRVVSEMFFYLGFLWGMMDKSSQAWHDKTAKTLVINV